MASLEELLLALLPTMDQRRSEEDLALGSNGNPQQSPWNDQNESRPILLGSDESLERFALLLQGDLPGE